MSWIYNEHTIFIEDLEPDVIGFVYLIENLQTNRKYVGKKNFFARKTYQVKKKKKRKQIESDWKDYYGSSEELKKDVELIGKEFFRRTILHFCRSKGEMSYLEIKEQILREALLSDDYYNSYIGCRIHRKHLKKWADADGGNQHRP